MDFFDFGYIGLFFASFLSATIVPFSSEAYLSIMIYADYNIFLSVIFATLGNTLGGTTGYFLGKLGKWDLIEKYLKIKKSKIESFRQKHSTKGSFFAFFSWLPFVGDFIPVFLGIMRINIFKVTFYMMLGKLLRYIIIAMISILLI
jgi:membrane protein YqaA with SNARE-associated domain